MKLFKSTLYKSFIGFTFLVAVLGCDDEFTSVGVNVIGGSDFEVNSIRYPLVAYTQKLNAVQTNNLSSHKLGVNTDPTFGTSVSSIVAQVTPTTFDPSFGTNPEIVSVILNIPYFSTVQSTTADGASTYTLDSVFGTQPIKLSIYENRVFLRDFDPSSDSQERQRYFSNSNSTINFDAQKGELLFTTESFFPNNQEVVFVPAGAIDETRLPPSLRFELLNTNNFWDTLLFSKEGEPELSNANNFDNHFRGLYIKSEAIGDGHVALMNLLNTNASLIVNYSFEGTDGVRTNAAYRMNFSGNIVNVYENNFNPNITTGNATEGDETLYLKGGEGAVAILDLFNGELTNDNGETEDALSHFNSNFKTENGTARRLINEANIVVYTDDNNPSEKPERLYLYDATNSTTLVDYRFDPTITTTPINSRLIFASAFTTDEDGSNGRYKFRITEHLNNILLNDSTNVKLGLVVTTNIDQVLNARVESTDNEVLKNIPISAVQSTKGVILHGSKTTVPENRRLQLEIFYSESN